MPDDLREIRERTKRIETRLTQLMIAMGVPTSAQKPLYDKEPGEHATLVLPSPHSSIREIVAALPPERVGETVKIYVGGELIGRLVVAAPA